MKRLIVLASLALAPLIVAAANLPPTITGSPPPTATVGAVYSFKPTAKDPEGKKISFVVKNRPSWLTFSYSLGSLTGTPTTGNIRTYSNIIIYAKDGANTKAMTPFSITVQPANRAPTISGTAPASVQAGTAYAFTPAASDPDGDSLTFTVANKPSWATFTAATGSLTGTPGESDVGAYANAAISVTDGKAQVTLPAFSISVTQATPPAVAWSACANEYGRCNFTGARRVRYGAGSTWVVRDLSGGVDCTNGAFGADPVPGASKRCEIGSTITAPPPANGRATLSWQAPTRNTDGSALTNLAGYRIYYGASIDAMVSINVNNAAVSTFVVENLTSGRWLFYVTAVTTGGAESAASNIATKTIT